jgi:hypothetical protein
MTGAAAVLAYIIVVPAEKRCATKNSQLGQQILAKFREAWVQVRCPPASGGISNVPRPARNAPARYRSLGIARWPWDILDGPPEAVGQP